MKKSRTKKILKNFESIVSPFFHFFEKFKLSSIDSNLDSRAGGNDKKKYSTKNLQPRLIGGQAKKGFAMLFSVLISSMLVVIGLSIFNITLKELTISTSGRESQIAFYAANSGMECALYWDLKGNGSRSAFASTNIQAEIDSAKTVPAVCNTVTVNSATSATTEFEFKINDPNDSDGPCVNVIVTKTPGTPSGKMTTIIESRGKNICGTSGRRVERGLKASIITEM